MVDHVTKGEFDVRAKTVPLKDLEQIWRTSTDDRIVLTPWPSAQQLICSDRSADAV